MLINKKNLDNKAFFIFTDSVYTSSVLCLFNKKNQANMLSYHFLFMPVSKFGLTMIYCFCNEWNKDIKKIYWKSYIDITGKPSRNEKTTHDDGHEAGQLQDWDDKPSQTTPQQCPEFVDYRQIFYIEHDERHPPTKDFSNETDTDDNDTPKDLSTKRRTSPFIPTRANEASLPKLNEGHNVPQQISTAHTIHAPSYMIGQRPSYSYFQYPDESSGQRDYTTEAVPDYKRTAQTPSMPSEHRPEVELSPYNRYSDFSAELRPEFSPINRCHAECSDHFSLLYDLIRNTNGLLEHREQIEAPLNAKRALNFDNPTYSPVIEPISPRSTSGNEHDAFNNYPCEECGKRYSTSSNLARHRQTHRSSSDKKARKCPHCEKVYVSMPAFSMHVRTHSQGCECPYCGKRFSRPWLLQVRLKVIFWEAMVSKLMRDWPWVRACRWQE